MSVVVTDKTYDMPRVSMEVQFYRTSKQSVTCQM